MDKLTIFDNKKPGSRSSKYVTKFEMDGSLSNIIEYLKTNKSPEIGNIRVISVSIKNDSEIERIMTCPLPSDSIIKTAIGDEPVYVKYDIAYNGSILVSRAIHPIILDSFFKFTETLTIIEENGRLFFERESIVFNVGKQLPLIGYTYQTYDDFFNRSNLCYYWNFSQIANGII